MNIYSVEGNAQWLDGGAMFGNAPKPVWEKWYAPDAHNRIRLACRAMLIKEDSGRLVLLEAGIGVFFEPKRRERFGVEGSHHALLDSLAALGVKPEDIDVIVLSHLHFDHAGGLLTPWAEGKAPELVFPRAAYVVGAEAWERACHPHARDRASFIPELQPLLEATGRLEVVRGESSETLGEGYTFFVSHGHTPGLLLTRVARAPGGPITFMGDLVPGAAWVHLPITMGYDRYPEMIIDEKTTLLGRMAEGGERAFFTHDAHHAAGRIVKDASGKYSATELVSELC